MPPLEFYALQFGMQHDALPPKCELNRAKNNVSVSFCETEELTSTSPQGKGTYQFQIR